MSGVLLAAVVLLQCYASRTQTGCTPLDYPPTMAECRALAQEYSRLDSRAVIVTGVPVVVRYHCVAGRDHA